MCEGEYRWGVNKDAYLCSLDVFFQSRGYTQAWSTLVEGGREPYRPTW